MRFASILHVVAPYHTRWDQLAKFGTTTVARAAYWGAVVLPLAYLVLLPAIALDRSYVTALAWLTAVHGVAVCIGLLHDPDR